MDALPFKPVSQGIRTLWVLQFREPLFEEQKPEVDFLIPSPFNHNEWINTNAQRSEQAIEILNQINKACAEIKHECQDAEMQRSLDQYLKKAKGVFSHLENLDQLMKNFDELMKRFSQPPPESEEEDSK